MATSRRDCGAEWTHVCNAARVSVTIHGVRHLARFSAVSSSSVKPAGLATSPMSSSGEGFLKKSKSPRLTCARALPVAGLSVRSTR
eukprot:6508287-Prymnesium_polylepis.1